MICNCTIFNDEKNTYRLVGYKRLQHKKIFEKVYKKIYDIIYSRTINENKYARHKPTTTTELLVPDFGQEHKEYGGLSHVCER